MSSSELSNALNPLAVSQRPRRNHANQGTQRSANPSRVAIPQQPSHRSELELAIVHPAPPPPASAPPAISYPDSTHNSQPAHGVATLQDLYTLLLASKESQAEEQKRRQDWEKEQETKWEQRELELKRQISAVQEEMASLRASVSAHPPSPLYAAMDTTALLSPPIVSAVITRTGSSATEIPVYDVPPSPVSPVPPRIHVEVPAFIQGSSSQPPLIMHQLGSPCMSATPSPNHVGAGELPAITLSPAVPLAPSPIELAATAASLSATPAVAGRKRSRSCSVSIMDESSDGDTSDTPATDRPLKRLGGHDGRCLTIHHAMRVHLRKLMKISSHDNLPENHLEGAPPGEGEPMRFVWTKTPRQSRHNAKMKERAVAELLASRMSYKHVPEKDFTQETLETTFDQVFTTLRQKYKAQKDAATASKLQKRETHKATKARRLQRKKMKLSNRAESRKRLQDFAHSAFDGALQISCMSSEESDGVEGEGEQRVQILKTRGLPWRSTRLLRFYDILDEEDRADKDAKPRRGTGRKSRREGPPKDSLSLPPVGAARWMVSRRWMRGVERERPDVVEMLRNKIAEAPAEDMTHVLLLGEDASDADEGATLVHPEAPVSDTSYALQNALHPL